MEDWPVYKVKCPTSDDRQKPKYRILHRNCLLLVTDGEASSIPGQAQAKATPIVSNATSPVMLITRKLTKDKRPVVDFRLLNTRILRRNTSIPLMSDVLSILGNSECEVVSCVDIKDAYHSIKLTEKSKEYCGILPYFGSPICHASARPPAS